MNLLFRIFYVCNFRNKLLSLFLIVHYLSYKIRRKVVVCFSILPSHATSVYPNSYQFIGHRGCTFGSRYTPTTLLNKVKKDSNTTMWQRSTQFTVYQHKMHDRLRRFVTSDMERRKPAPTSSGQREGRGSFGRNRSVNKSRNSFDFLVQFFPCYLMSTLLLTCTRTLTLNKVSSI